MAKYALMCARLSEMEAWSSPSRFSQRTRALSFAPSNFGQCFVQDTAQFSRPSKSGTRRGHRLPATPKDLRASAAVPSSPPPPSPESVPEKTEASAQNFVKNLRESANDAGLVSPTGKPSHQLVNFDGYEPARFVFVEERDCIGCTHCATTAPGTFFLDDSYGRARAYNQSGNSERDIDEAIDTCPVNCIYYTTFEDLVTLEKERQGQVINNDTRLVGGQDLTATMNTSTAEISNSNIMSCTNCPRRGCPECPLYGVGENPTYLKKKKELEAKRRQRRGGGSSQSGGVLL